MWAYDVVTLDATKYFHLFDLNKIILSISINWLLVVSLAVLLLVMASEPFISSGCKIAWVNTVRGKIL